VRLPMQYSGDCEPVISLPRTRAALPKTKIHIAGAPVDS
jgi:hypothetical protein